MNSMRYVTVMIWWLSVVLCMACSSQYNGDKGAIDKTKKAKGDKESRWLEMYSIATEQLCKEKFGF